MCIVFISKSSCCELFLVLFIEPSDKAHRTPLKAGHLFMNRFAIDEDAGFEIINVLELEKLVE